jgi:hypothetical protein
LLQGKGNDLIAVNAFQYLFDRVYHQIHIFQGDGAEQDVFRTCCSPICPSRNLVISPVLVRVISSHTIPL